MCPFSLCAYIVMIFVHCACLGICFTPFYVSGRCITRSLAGSMLQHWGRRSGEVYTELGGVGCI